MNNMQLLPYEAFWIYISIFLVSTLLTIVIGYILANRAPSKVKSDTFECGQEEDIHPHETYIRGANRYFAYAVAFFILDAFTWMIIAGAISISTYLIAGFLISVYIIILISVLAYYVIKVREAL